MKTKIKSINIIVVVLVIINIFACILLSKNKADMRKIATKYQLQIDQLTNVSKNLFQLSRIQYMAESEIVNNVMLYSIEGDSIPLQETLSTIPKLIYYFSSNGCPGCFEPIISQLDTLGQKIGYENILILAKFSNNRNLKSYWSDKPQHIPIYRVNENLGLFYSPDYDYAYAFLLSHNMNVRKFIVTDKSNVTCSDNYFDLIVEYFHQGIVK